MDISSMMPRRPYLLRAFYEWIVDNELTPHLVVDATMNGVRVPEEFVQDGQIVLNVAPHSVGNLEMGNEAVTFNARFGGRPHSLILPLYAIQAIYARENGAGTMFEPEEAYELSSEEGIFEEDLVSTSEEDSSSDDKPEPPRPTGRPSLRVVK
ncbi:ClpXP protease specificity-enhancing factor [Aliivibrio sp. S4TY2]|uniref:ClpXP protease specificity-enhancing factor n=1 Tax=Aliivibrio finisterrensis TaxID=511998 RepID=A0A4Q5KHN8_9GAMM|nr:MULTISPECIES: ClpXP protease specificity-enhancing factor [Aliivibrio]MDD9155885.1 ClpXP protease specificity-enhancing factor [Aliivibrio sp. S4TY2]MDD9159435.1 ClpXP protease specificity-enhancing factor [Aliivibrio sp. S4TY1]MDD9163593.1 ClpXP protease specificity-enhancing factor [Aliivibrio sp. S4MY2]MDD9167594.1 ClpXP protease specificity-enhancing factor [Aliivibrio sp. S4MY4]MDD9175642.1 ClpXP protease specificity-enhancing factor [Aliivibrio sp. S3TY1]